MARKRRKKPLLNRLQKAADKSLSVYIRELTIRAYGNCPFCRSNPVQCCFHFIRRRRKVLRWCASNVIGACHRCNYIEYRNPDPSRGWFIRTYGVDRYLGLVDRSAKDFIPTIQYLERLIAHYDGLYRKLSGVTL